MNRITPKIIEILIDYNSFFDLYFFHFNFNCFLSQFPDCHCTKCELEIKTKFSVILKIYDEWFSIQIQKIMYGRICMTVVDSLCSLIGKAAAL